MAVGNLVPRTLLLGGGYTLQRVASRLPAQSFVITSRSQLQCDQWTAQGWNAAKVALDEQTTVEELFAAHPTLEVVVDSVPPLRVDGHGVQGTALGVRNVIRGLAGSAVRRVVYLSTTGVFGVRDGSWVDESTPPAPWNAQGAARLECEEAYREAARTHKAFSVTALRLPAIYGPDRGVAVSLRAGTYALVGDGSQWTNRIHVDDLAACIVRCIEHPGDLPPVLCINDDYPTQARDVVSYVCEREGLPWPPSVSPEEVLQRGAYTMLSNQRVRNQMMKTVLGVSLQYPSYREGIVR